MVAAGTAQHHFATADGNSGEIGRRLDTVGDDLVIRGMQVARLDAFDDQRRRADAGDLGTHADQERAQVGNLGLARSVVDHGTSLGMHCCRQDVFRGPDAGELERDLRAVQAIGPGFDYAVL